MWQLHNGWTDNYRTALGNVVLGRIVSVTSARTATLGIRIRGVPESKATTDIARVQEDLTTIDKIPAFPEIEDRKLTSHWDGKIQSGRRTQKTVVQHWKWNQQRPDFERHQSWVTYLSFRSISAQNYRQDAKKGNGCRKTRRQLISKGFDPKTIRRKNLMREVLEGGQWLSIAESGGNRNWTNGPQQVNTSNDDANLQQMSTSSTFFLLYRSVY